MTAGAMKLARCFLILPALEKTFQKFLKDTYGKASCHQLCRRNEHNTEMEKTWVMQVVNMKEISPTLVVVMNHKILSK